MPCMGLSKCIPYPYSYIIQKPDPNVEWYEAYRDIGNKRYRQFQGSDAKTVIQNAIDALDAGGIFMKYAPYNFSDSAVIQDKKIKLWSDGAIINNNHATNPAFIIRSTSSFWDVEGSVIKGFQINGNASKANNGVLIQDAIRVTLEDIDIANTNIAVELKNVTSWSEANILRNIYVSDALYGVKFTDGGSGHQSFDLTNINHFIMNIYRSGAYGLYMADSHMNRGVINNFTTWHHADSCYGFYFADSTQPQMINAFLGCVGFESFVTTPTALYGIRMGSQPIYPYKAYFVGSFTSYVTGTTNNFIPTNCPQWVNKNNGTGTITAGNTYVDVTHNLSITPDITRISLIPKDNLNGKYLWISGSNSTSFRINISSSDTVNHNIGWSYD